MQCHLTLNEMQIMYLFSYLVIYLLPWDCIMVRGMKNSAITVTFPDLLRRVIFHAGPEPLQSARGFLSVSCSFTQILCRDHQALP